MSRTGDMAIDAQVRDEMAREAGPELAKALRDVLAKSYVSIGEPLNVGRPLGYVEISALDDARAVLRKAGLEP